MEIKVLLFLAALFGSSLGQSLNCTYSDVTIQGVPRYLCSLTIQNPTGFDAFTTIGGTHLQGRTNANVTAVITTLASRTINFPRILCAQFINLVYVDFSQMNVVALNENTLAECRNLGWLRFWENDIEEIHERAFANNSALTYLDLDSNNIRSLPDNVFSNLANLLTLELRNNPFGTIQGGLFRGLTNLRTLLIGNMNILEINPQWFETLGNLQALSLYRNNITNLPENIFASLRNLTGLEISRNPLNPIPAGFFRNMTNLEELYMSNCRITEINTQWFENLQNLEILYIYSNLFTSIANNTFDRLTNLLAIDIGDNHLTENAIPATLFDNMPNLVWLINDFNIIQNINPRWFERITRLTVIIFDFNAILELPSGVFVPILALRELDLWGNYIKTVNRNAFGNLTNLRYVDFDRNVINAIDERFLLETTNLYYLDLWNNLCTSERFFDFSANRVNFLPRLGLCTNNFRFTVDTVTEVGDNYSFYPGQNPGIQVRVNSPQDINIALTPFDFPWTPMVEIFIGVENNTLSRIVRNRETVVVNVPTPNILRDGQWSGFRITWANQVILVTRDGQQFPFMAYTLEDFFPVNFYGLRSPQNRAIWSVQPVEAGIMPTDVIN